MCRVMVVCVGGGLGDCVLGMWMDGWMDGWSLYHLSFPRK